MTRWLDEHGTGSAFVETAVFDRVTRVLAQSRERFAAMEESLGLYSAISHLPERRYDSIVLCYVLKYPYSRVASLLGVSESTVRSNVRHAKEHLAKELGIPYSIGNEA